MMDKNELPDVAQDSRPPKTSKLNWVGMKGIVMPLIFVDKDIGKKQVRSIIDCYVDLNNPQKRGIHMSRMYLKLADISHAAEVNYGTLIQLSNDLIDEQEGSSSSSKVSIGFDLCIQRESLLSAYQGWLDYPIDLSIVNQAGKIKCQIKFNVVYSSTCPCSAALSRQLVSKRFVEHFDKSDSITKEDGAKWLKNEEKMMATPHSQRSIAEIKIIVNPQGKFPFVYLINRAEEVLKTRVQTVVKREDEQHFASINGENLMFCEDAARILQKEFSDFSKDGLGIKAHHQESLHPHDAVAEVINGELID